MADNFEFTQSYLTTIASFARGILHYDHTNGTYHEPFMRHRHPQMAISLDRFAATLPRNFIDFCREKLGALDGFQPCISYWAADHVVACNNHIFININNRLNRFFHMMFDRHTHLTTKDARRRYMGYLMHHVWSDGKYEFRETCRNPLPDDH